MLDCQRLQLFSEWIVVPKVRVQLTLSEFVGWSLVSRQMAMSRISHGQIYIYISYDLPINIPIKWLVNVGHVCVFIFHGGSRWITHVYQFLNSKWSGNHCFWWLNMVKHRSQMSKSPVRQDTAASSQVLPVCTPEPGNSVCVVGSPLYSNIIP